MKCKKKHNSSKKKFMKFWIDGVIAICQNKEVSE